MPEILNLIDALAGHVGAGNLEGAISLVEKLIALVEAMVVKPAAPVDPAAK